MDIKRFIVCIRTMFAAVGCTILVLALPVNGQTQPSSREQLKQYVADLQKNPLDDTLREKIIKLAPTLDPEPAVPPEVDELAGKGEYILQHATSDADLSAAADAFAKASLMAPWVPDYYFDQGVVWEKVKNYDKAVKNFEFYLLGVPADSDDAKKARQHLGGVKYALEKQEAADTAQRQQQEAARQRFEEEQREQRELQTLWGGVWRITGGDAKDPRYRGEKFRHDSYHESHLTFQIQGNQITEIWCYDRPDETYHNAEGFVSSRSGNVSGRMATFTAFDETTTLQLNGNGDIEVREPRSYPGEIPWIYSRVNDPRAISSRCSQ